jgi:hypothetical protein
MKGSMLWATGALAAVALSTVLSAPACAIVNGEPDGDQHPNVGVVIAYDPLYGKIIPYMSGTLIDQRVFLTAGHGAEPIVSGEVTLLGVSFDQDVNLNVGPDFDLDDPSTWPSAWLAVDHVECSWGPLNGVGGVVDNVEGADPNRTDIALLILKDPVTWIAPTTLPTADFLDNLKQAGLLQAGPQGTLLTVVGYGRGLAFPPPENVPAISPDGYAHRNVAKTGYLGLNDAWLNTSQNLAAGYGGTAAGDSGGPVFWIDPEGNEHLVAITAWGGSLIGNGFYYRIDTAESLAFIQGVIGSLGSE